MRSLLQSSKQPCISVGFPSQRGETEARPGEALSPPPTTGNPQDQIPAWLWSGSRPWALSHDPQETLWNATFSWREGDRNHFQEGQSVSLRTQTRACSALIWRRKASRGCRGGEATSEWGRTEKEEAGKETWPYLVYDNDLGTNWCSKAGISLWSSKVFCLVENLLQSTLLHITNESWGGTNHSWDLSWCLLPTGLLNQGLIMPEIPRHWPTIQDMQYDLWERGWAAIPYPVTLGDPGQSVLRAGCARPMASIGISTPTSTYSPSAPVSWLTSPCTWQSHCSGAIWQTYRVINQGQVLFCSWCMKCKSWGNHVKSQEDVNTPNTSLPGIWH